MHSPRERQLGNNHLDNKCGELHLRRSSGKSDKALESEFQCRPALHVSPAFESMTPIKSLMLFHISPTDTVRSLALNCFILADDSPTAFDKGEQGFDRLWDQRNLAFLLEAHSTRREVRKYL